MCKQFIENSTQFVHSQETENNEKLTHRKVFNKIACGFKSDVITMHARLVGCNQECDCAS